MTTTRRFVLARRIILTTASAAGLLVLLWLSMVVEAAPPQQPTSPTPTATLGIPSTAPAPVPLAVSAEEANCNAEKVGVFTAWSPDHKTAKYPVDFATTARQFFTNAHKQLNTNYQQIGQCTADEQLADAEKYKACTQLSTSALSAALNGPTVVAFMTGHGKPESLSTNPDTNQDPVVFSSLELGACSQNSKSPLRYLLLSSCNTLAHGPRKDCSKRVTVPNPSGGGKVLVTYACPGEWKSGAPDNADVYTRWGPRLGNGMRMVCGGSTMVTPSTTDYMWTSEKKYGKDGVMVADAFVNALSSDTYVGLCLARGGSDFSQSPLMHDTQFDTVANPFDDAPDVYYHAQYGRSFAPGSSPVNYAAAPPLGAFAVTSESFAQGYSPVRGILDSSTLITETGGSLQALSEVMPRCLPAVNSAGIVTNFVSVAPQLQQLVAYSTESEALGVPEQSENQYISAAIGAVITSDVAATGPFTLYTGYAQAWHNMLTMVPADPEQRNDTSLRVAEKNAVISFPQLVGLNEIRPQIASGNPDIPSVSDPILQQLVDFYGQLAATYQIDETDTQPWANLIDPNSHLPLLPIRDREFTARINPDRSIIDYSYRIERILPGDQSRETYRTVTPYDAFLYSLNRLCNLSKSTEQDAVPISQKMPFDAILQGCNRAFNQLTGGSGFPYRLRSWNWGYAPPQGADGGKMKLFYRFEYIPDVEAGFSADRFPARMIWVQGQSEKACP